MFLGKHIYARIRSIPFPWQTIVAGAGSTVFHLLALKPVDNAFCP
jgi:hypothetical protein